MGWTGMSRIPEDRAAFCRSELGANCEVLADSMIGSTWYAAVKNKETGAVFAAVFLTKISRYQGEREFMYKTMDESVGPCERDCPKKILDLLTEPYNEYARQWRADCQANREKKRAAAKGEGRYVEGATLYAPSPLTFRDGGKASVFTVCYGISRKGKKVLRFRRPDGARCMIGGRTREWLMTEAEHSAHQARAATVVTGTYEAHF